MKQRNPNARCGNCPYWDNSDQRELCNSVKLGACSFDATSVQKSERRFCRHHPDFWREPGVCDVSEFYEEEPPPINALTAAAIAMEEAEKLRAELDESKAERARIVDRLTTSALSNEHTIDVLRDDRARLEFALAQRDAVIARLKYPVELFLEAKRESRGIGLASHLSIVVANETLVNAQAALDAAKEITP